MCTSCVAELKTTYKFKHKCLNSTKTIKRILYKNEFNCSENNIKIKDVCSYLPSDNSHFIEISQGMDKGSSEKVTETEEYENIEQEEEESDDSIDDILRDKFGNDIEEKYDDDHSYFSKTNENSSENENSSRVENSVNVKVENHRNIDEILLHESAVDPIFPNLSLQSDASLCNRKITVKIENTEDNISNHTEYGIMPEDTLTESEIDPMSPNLPVQVDMRITGNLQARENPTKYQYFCTICNLGFEDNFFKEHSEIHEHLEIISCPTCKRDFDTLDMKLYFRHYCPQHNRPFLVTCTVCYRKFKSSQALANHNKIHKDKERLFFCHHCDFYFPTAQKLDWHMRNGIHTDQVTKKLKRV